MWLKPFDFTAICSREDVIIMITFASCLSSRRTGPHSSVPPRVCAVATRLHAATRVC